MIGMVIGCFQGSVSLLAPSLWGWNIREDANFSTMYLLGPGLPPPRSGGDNIPSACGSSSNSQKVSYSCPHMLLFSTDMILASVHDGLQNDFYYGVAGGSTDKDCGSCYQIKPSGLEKQLILQIFNFGYDVAPGQFDVFMAAGGFGYFTACNHDCHDRYCQGGPCAYPMYSGTFTDWTSPTGDCYGGGLSGDPDPDTLWKQCRALSNGDYGYKDQVLWQSCYYSHIFSMHQNYDHLLYMRVRCPDGLAMLTGLRRPDDGSMPVAHKDNHLTSSCDRRNCMTTTQDCCKPACSYSGKGTRDWSRVDSCWGNGLPIYDAS